MASKQRTSQLHVRSTDEENLRWNELARKFGYPNISEFIRAVLCAMSDKYETESWASGLVHLDGDRVTDPVPDTPDLIGIYAFPVAAPARFWRYLEAIRNGQIQIRQADQTHPHPISPVPVDEDGIRGR